MSAGRYDLVIEQGATYERKIAYRDAAGVLVSLTDWSVQSHVRENIADATPKIVLAGGGGIDYIKTGSFGSAPNNYNISINISPTVTVAQTSYTTGYWDMELVDPSGKVIRLLEGRVKIVPEVTR